MRMLQNDYKLYREHLVSLKYNYLDRLLNKIYLQYCQQ